MFIVLAEDWWVSSKVPRSILRTLPPYTRRISIATCYREAAANACPPFWNSVTCYNFNPLQFYVLMMFGDAIFFDLRNLWCKTCQLHAAGVATNKSGLPKCMRWPWKSLKAPTCWVIYSVTSVSGAQFFFARLIKPFVFPAWVSQGPKPMNEKKGCGGNLPHIYLQMETRNKEWTRGSCSHTHTQSPSESKLRSARETSATKHQRSKHHCTKLVSWELHVSYLAA